MVAAIAAGIAVETGRICFEIGQAVERIPTCGWIKASSVWILPVQAVVPSEQDRGLKTESASAARMW
ncbi:MAG: hypothetical protein U0841_33805 [Chloroflexia bacterium]